MFCNLDKVIYEGCGKFDIPEVQALRKDVDVSHWLAFDLTRKVNFNMYRQEIGIHFFLHDYQFECLWNNPNKYIDNFKKCGAVCMTDFSMYTDFPKAIQIYNKYRNHWLARFYQDRGITVLPTLLWSDDNSLEWSFDGYEKGGIYALPEIGIVQDEECINYFTNGVKESVRKLHPQKLYAFCKSTKHDMFDFGVETEWINTGFNNKMDAYSKIKESGI